MEIKNTLMVTTRGGVDNGERRGRVFRNYCKGHMDKTKGEGGSKGGRWGGVEWRGGEKMQTTVIEQQF